MIRILKLIKNSIVVLWTRHHLIVPPKYWKRYWKSFKKRLSFKTEYLNPFNIKEYNKWLKYNSDCKIEKLNYNPLISFIIPVYNINPDYLKDCLDSILNQTYQNFEICLADDNSTKKETIETLKEYEKKDPRVKVTYRKENGHISKATNTALEMVTGEYVALMDDDDILDKNALFKVAKAINKNKNLEFIYSDEDKLDMKNRLCEPHFKPDFSPHSFYGGNYICHFTIIKKTLLDKIGGLREEYVGAQDFDLFLRATESTKNICHIPEILYHWRKVPGSTADTIGNKVYAIENGKKAVEDALKRKGKDAYVTTPIKTTHYVVHYNIHKTPLVSVIMLDNSKTSIKNNIKELQKDKYYNNLEIFIKSSKEYNVSKNITVIDEEINDIIQKAKGQYILIISGKIKITNPNLLTELLGYASQKEIGVVGPKIYNYGKLIKSAGLILSNKNIYIDAFSSYFNDSYGLYGRLLVPYNYTAISDIFFMFDKEKYNEVGGFEENINFTLASIDFNLKLAKKYENVVLNNLFIYQKSSNRTERYALEENEKDFLRKKWNLDDDKFYNKNLSKDYGFMLKTEVRYEKK